MGATVEKLTKSFAGARVLNAVDIVLQNGEVHALLGANGSGKSTLVKCLTGVYQPDAGSMTIGQRTLPAITSPRVANELGIAVVHQDAPLIDTMTVAECIALFRGYPTSSLGRVRWRQLQDSAAALLQRFHLSFTPNTLAGKLGPAERALVAMAIALDQVKAGLELLVLDEVTATLPEDQARVFLDRVGQIAAEGTAVLMVTHRLPELHGLARSVTILRHGSVVHSGPTGEVSNDTMVAHMVGSGAKSAMSAPQSRGTIRRVWSVGSETGRQAPSQRIPSSDGTALAIEGLSGSLLRDLTFSIKSGEIVGMAGLIGSGIGELPQILAGMKSRDRGEMRVGGNSLARTLSPSDLINAGMTVLPADRLRSGGITTATVGENVVLPQFDRFWHARERERGLLAEMIAGFDVRPPSAKSIFGNLSGGNQQKALLGKWMLMRPTVLVLDDPTSGVDPGARAKIFDLLRDAAGEGVAVLLFSTEPEQLAAICSRVLILRDGTIVTELAGDTLSREAISRWCYA